MSATNIDTPMPAPSPVEEQDTRKRRMLLLILLALALVFCCLLYFIVRYMLKPQPLPEMLPAPVSQNVYYPPTYKFSINNVDGPVGVAISPNGQRVYVAESRGERLIKMFDRDGNMLKSFAPHGTTKSTRQPIYLAVDARGRVFLTDRLNNVIDIFDADGNYLDAILAQDMTLSKLLNTTIPGGLVKGTTFFYEGVNKVAYYKLPDGTEGAVQVQPSVRPWAPLGLSFDQQGNLLYTDLTLERHSVQIIPAKDLNGPLEKFDPILPGFGVQGKDPGQLDFPNDVVVDKKGNYYVADGNNARISSWTGDFKSRSFFGFGSNAESLNLPRGLWIDNKDRLHVADAVGSVIRVYDVSGDAPKFLYSFGAYGSTEGAFRFPNDITMDGTGRLYIADRENDRIQVWSY
jgi:sugar lactone lactonase YvrE